MRIRPASKSGTQIREIYGEEVVYERHRHRYELNNRYRQTFEERGLRCSGTSPDGLLVEYVELTDHPFYVATQAHPEFKSRPNRPHPLFAAFVEAARQRAEGRSPRLPIDTVERAPPGLTSRSGLMQTFDELLTEYHEWLAVERGLAANSLQAYRRDLRRYAGYLAAQGITDPATIGEHTVHGYVAHLEALRDDDGHPQFAPASIARSVVAVRSFHRFCARRATCRPIRAKRSARRVCRRASRRRSTRSRSTRLLGAVEGDTPRAQRDRALLELLYATGIRISEAVGLDLEDLDLEDGLLRVLGKGDKERVVPVGRTASAALVAYLREGRLALRNARRAPRRRHRCGVPQRTRDAPLTAGVLDDRAGRGRAGRPAGAAVAARPAALVRDAHARSRCRPPHRAGAARPRHHLDHAGVHQGLAGTAPRRLRIRPPARLRAEPRSEGGRPLSPARAQALARAGRPRTRGTIPGMSGTTHASLRAHLVTERDRVSDQLVELGVDRDSFDEGFADSGQVTAERGEVEALVGTLQETLTDIDAALAKFDGGDYGVCESCGGPDQRGSARSDAGRATVHHVRIQAPLSPS